MRLRINTTHLNAAMSSRDAGLAAMRNRNRGITCKDRKEVLENYLPI